MGPCRKDYHRKWSYERRDGGISKRDEKVANLPPLDAHLCRKIKKASVVGCHCSLLFQNKEYQKQLQGGYIAVVRNSQDSSSGNKLLASYITCSSEADKNKYDHLLRKGMASRIMISKIVHYSYRLPGYRDGEKPPGEEFLICSAVFMKLFSLGKPRFKKLQGLSNAEYNRKYPAVVQPALKRPIVKKEECEIIDVDNPTGAQEVVDLVNDDPLPDIRTNLNDFGTLVDVAPDGNCGFHAVIFGLCDDLKRETRNWPVDEFRRTLRDHALHNETRLFNMEFYRSGTRRKRSKTEQEELEKKFGGSLWMDYSKKRRGAHTIMALTVLPGWMEQNTSP